DGAGCPGERQHGLQCVSGEADTLVLPAAGAEGGRLVGEGRLQHRERNREDEDDGEKRRESPVLRGAEQTAPGHVEGRVRGVEQAEDEEEQGRLPKERPYSRRSKRGREGGATSHPIILDKLAPADAPEWGRHVRMSGLCARVAIAGCIPRS